MSGRGRGGPALFRPPNRSQTTATGTGLGLGLGASAVPATLKPIIAALRPESDEESEHRAAPAGIAISGATARSSGTAGSTLPASRLHGVVIHVGADYGIISDDMNGGRRYKYRLRDVRPVGAPTTDRVPYTDGVGSAVRSAFAGLQVYSVALVGPARDGIGFFVDV